MFHILNNHLHSTTDVTFCLSSLERNVVEAASNGASQSAKLIANIAVNLIAFIAALEFVNLTLKWFGVRVGLEPPNYEYLTFQVSFIDNYISNLKPYDTKGCH